MPQCATRRESESEAPIRPILSADIYIDRDIRGASGARSARRPARGPAGGSPARARARIKNGPRLAEIPSSIRDIRGRGYVLCVRRRSSSTLELYYLCQALGDSGGVAVLPLISQIDGEQAQAWFGTCLASLRRSHGATRLPAWRHERSNSRTAAGAGHRSGGRAALGTGDEVAA